MRKVNPSSALAVQEGGGHYKGMAIQPVEYITANRMDFISGCIVKYASRHGAKGGAEDVRKIIHFAELLLELVYGEKRATSPSSDVLTSNQDKKENTDVNITNPSGVLDSSTVNINSSKLSRHHEETKRTVASPYSTLTLADQVAGFDRRWGDPV